VRRSAWTTSLLLTVVLLGLADALLLELTSSYFSGGYSSPALRGALPVAAFFGAGALVDATLVLGFWCLLLPLLRRLGMDEPRMLAATTILSVAAPLLYDVLRFRLHRVAGDMLALPQLWQLAGSELQPAVAEGIASAGILAVLLPLVPLGLWLGVRWASRHGQWLAQQLGDLAPPRARWCWLGLAIGGLVGSALHSQVAEHWPEGHFGIARKPSASWIAAAVNFVTDLDRDGFGMLSLPADAAPFDGSRFPFALEIPGNGVDENGLAGDRLPGPVAARPALP
jgi:hypothetical protein